MSRTKIWCLFNLKLFRNLSRGKIKKKRKVNCFSLPSFWREWSLSKDKAFRKVSQRSMTVFLLSWIKQGLQGSIKALNSKKVQKKYFRKIYYSAKTVTQDTAMISFLRLKASPQKKERQCQEVNVWDANRTELTFRI